MYHWACQTNVHNVLSWVKVENLYMKNFFTSLRAVCTAAVCEKYGKLGGPGKKIEVRTFRCANQLRRWRFFFKFPCVLN